MSTRNTEGDAGDNTLTGTAGSEQFDGGKGSDTYIYAAGGGQDTIAATYDTAGNKVDTLQLDGIASADLQFSRSGNDLVIGFKGTTSDSITVKLFFLGNDPYNDFNPLQRITFMSANGSTAQDPLDGLSIASIITALTTGGSGDDDLRGTAGADTLIGGAGNDTLTGGAGNDEYRFNRGDSKDLIAASYDLSSAHTDTLALGTGLSRNDLSFASTGSGGTSLLIRFAGSTDEITVEKFLYNDNAVNTYGPLQSITFADDKVTTLKGDSTAPMDVAAILKALYTGTAGADNQHGTAGNDSITGLAGGDLIDGRAGDDTLVGGAGDDTLNGGTGNDAYDYTRGNGNDLIKLQSDSNANKNNILHFASGITADDVSLTRSGSSLLIGIKGAGTIPASTITVEGFSFTAGTDNGYNPLQQIIFDGTQTTWTFAMLQAAVAAAGSGGTSNSPTTGADQLTGTTGADTLTGGTGNDTITGGLGDDTCVYRAGDGQDTLLSTHDSTPSNTLQLNGIAATDLLLSRSGSDLVIGFSGKPGDSITAKLFFFNDDPYNDYNPLQKITFMSADGKTPQTPIADYDIAELITKMNTGGTGNDRLVGTSGDDVMSGGLGNDTLIGGKGNDTIEFTVGDGRDLITSLTQDTQADRTDVLEIHTSPVVGASKVTANSLTFGTSGTSLVIKVGTNGDQITVDKFLYQDDTGNGYNPLQEIKFDDGTSLSVAGILAQLYKGSSSADTLRGTAGADTITALAGNDTIDGRGGDDRIEGGAGNDLIDGGKGNDSYWFGLGEGADTLLGVYDDASGKSNTLVFRAGIVESDVKLTRSGSDLVITLNAFTATNKESFTVKNFSFALNSDSTYNPLQAITFDGVTTGTDAKGNPIKASWTLADIQGKVVASGSTGSTSGDDSAQTLKGTDADDRIDGGKGNDTIDGGKGNDTCVFEQGDGSDTLSLSRDTTVGRTDTLELKYLQSSEATLTRSGSDLVIGTPTSGDQVTVKGFFLLNNPYNAYNPLQSIAFNDATKDIAWIVKQTNTGTGGSDKLVGTTGSDTLIGGKGNDTLIGGKGDDVYQFSVGDGLDVITVDASDNTVGRNDTLHIVDPLLSADKLVLETSGTSLIIGLSGDATDQITVENFLYGDTASNPYNPLQTISFDSADSHGKFSLDLSGILAKLYGGTSGTDILRGTVDADSISGSYGNDTLDGRAGNDTLNGGAGNDTLTGGTGDNTYEFANGDGQDSLMGYRDTAPGKNSSLQLDDYTTDDIVLTQLKGALIVEFNKVDKSNTDKITVNNFDFTGSGSDYSPVQNIAFSGSTTPWGMADILDHITGVASTGDEDDNRLGGTVGNDTLTGLDGDDTLTGLAGKDLLTGGLGDDSINGGLGDDTYAFNKGDGQDTLAAGGNATDTNTLAFGSDVASSDLAFTRMGTSLVIYLNKTDTDNTDQITVEDFSFSAGDGNTSSPLQAITVGGATWDLATIRGKVGGLTLTGTDGDDTVRGADLNDSLYGGAGDDTLFGYDGKDTLIGGAGDDVMYGGDGNDTLLGQGGNDVLDGGKGNDQYFYFGDGQDTLAASGDTTDEVNTLGISNNSISSSSVLVTRKGTSLVIYMDKDDLDDTNQITVEDFSFSADDGNTSNPLQIIQWSGHGSDWNLAKIRTEVSGLDRIGTDSANTLRGGDLNDTLSGGKGDDTLFGYGGNDVLWGSSGNDLINGGDGDDTYNFTPGDGDDVLVDSGGDDTFDTDVSKRQVFFKQDGNDLEVYVYGGATDSTAEILRIEDWYLGAAHQIESILAKASGGTVTLSSTDVASLVTAMADFDLPATAGDLSTTDGYDAVLTAMNKYWKS
ncbi:calcium-binding protein [Rhizobacter sp. OV335]|uniref:calcium-binding protein n=1 Tax=Rhizobacter sp. OV335 TaxID=1500264 RepID=UPI000921D915|nr:calcium-binding protein [Rhizobacter sp. OV335]SHM89259.1 Hemolysin-type calcium-binding repeat-containing protein [Rhizobacter sp. OV335]